MATALILLLASLTQHTFAQATLSSNSFASIPPVSVPNYCLDGYTAGSDSVLLDIPYPFTSVLRIMSDFGNLTWSGNPPSTVSLNGTDNAPGTARMYSLQGINVVETLSSYRHPVLMNTPSLFSRDSVSLASRTTINPNLCTYHEVHSTAEIFFAAANLTVYMPTDGETVTPLCDGRAARVNMSATFCAAFAEDVGKPLDQSSLPEGSPSAADITQALLHALHAADAAAVADMLGGKTFSGCDGLPKANFVARDETTWIGGGSLRSRSSIEERGLVCL